LKILRLDRKQVEAGNWRKGKGCPKCFNSGYLGREAVVELINVDRPVRDAIHEGTTTQLDRFLTEDNYVSFRTSAIEKVLTGVTTVEEVLRVIPHSAFAVHPKSAVPDTKVVTNGNGHHPELHLVKYQP
jgi:type II secretory ATPase GspE/PulE/Tfp pilus assembly ATPase PilB-like protein